MQDSQGEGIAAVNIDLFEAGTSNEIVLSGDATASDGSYATTIPAVIAAGFYDVVLQAPLGTQFFDGVQASVFIGGNTTIPLTVLESGWFVSGRVTDEMGAWGEARKGVVRNKPLAWATAAAVLTVLVGGIGFAFKADQATKAAELATNEAARADTKTHEAEQNANAAREQERMALVHGSGPWGP